MEAQERRSRALTTLPSRVSYLLECKQETGMWVHLMGDAISAGKKEAHTALRLAQKTKLDFGDLC